MSIANFSQNFYSSFGHCASPYQRHTPLDTNEIMNEQHEAILAKIRSRGALQKCTECGGSTFEYVGHSTGATVLLNPDSLKPSELLPNTYSYKTHIVACSNCYRILGFMDRE